MQKISVILIVFNMAEYLSDCLDSLLSQTYKNTEIICINDGSTDNSLEILSRYAQKDNRIKVYSQENMGIPSSRNAGTEKATGDYITFADADDILSDNALEVALNVALKNDSDMVVNYNFLNKSLKNLSWLTTWQMFIKKSFLDSHKDLFFNPELKKGSDAVFSHKILSITDKISVNYGKSFYFYGQHDRQITKTFDKNSEDLLNNLKLRLEDIKEFYIKHGLFESRNYLLMNFIMEQLFGHYVVSKWNKSQKKELFDLIRSFISEYNISFKFNPQDRKSLFFFVFLHCKSMEQFEIPLFFARLSYKLSCLPSKLRRKKYIKY